MNIEEFQKQQADKLLVFVQGCEDFYLGQKQDRALFEQDCADFERKRAIVAEVVRAHPWITVSPEVNTLIQGSSTRAPKQKKEE